jgi:hypothetical protein
MSPSICVDNLSDSSVDLSYTDSGVPTGASNSKYVTIIAIHGFGFSAGKPIIPAKWSQSNHFHLTIIYGSLHPF